MTHGSPLRRIASAFALAACLQWPGGAAAQSPPAPSVPYQRGGGQSLTVNGHVLPRDMVFRFLPVTLPLVSIRITSLFGMRRNPFGGPGTEFHPGVDFGAPRGETVFSTAAGIVTFVGPRGAYGDMVEVSHGLGFKTRSSHLSAYYVREGQVVDRNTPIGAIGSTGRSTGNHLYWEIWRGAERVDPVDFVLRAYALYHHLN